MALVRLQMAPFAPFIPGVDEDQWVRKWKPGRPVQAILQPSSVQLGSAPLQDEPPSVTAAGIVPHGRQSRKAGPRGLRSLEHSLHQRPILVHSGDPPAQHPPGVADDPVVRQPHVPPGGLELHRGVEPQGPRIVHLQRPRFHPDQQDLSRADFRPDLPPDVRGLLDIRDLRGPVDQQYRSAIHPDRPRIAQRGGQELGMDSMIRFRIALLLEHTSLLSAPGPSPRLVGPAQAERDVRSSRLQHGLEWALQQTAPLEPVVVVAEACDTMLLSQLGLPLTHHGIQQVVVAKL